MTRHLGSLGEMGMFLAMRVPEIAIELHHGLERIAQRIERTAKAEFGHYQPATGSFPEWPELAESTKDDRAAKGFAENEPLLRTGELHDSIEHEVHGAELEAVIGSKDERMEWHELGTERMPARPVLGPAAFLNRDAIQKLVGAAVVAGLIGKTDFHEAGEIHDALGYNAKTAD